MVDIAGPCTVFVDNTCMRMLINPNKMKHLDSIMLHKSCRVVAEKTFSLIGDWWSSFVSVLSYKEMLCTQIFSEEEKANRVQLKRGRRMPGRRVMT